MSNRRKPSRIRIKRGVKRIPAWFEAGDVCGSGHIARVSREGMFFSAETLPQTGSDVRVVFSDRDGNKIEVFGSVRWTTAECEDHPDTGFGMHIERTNPEFQDFYEEILTG